MQGNDNYRLVVRRGPQPNQVYELNKDVLNLGRDITNDIVINDKEVSRHHLRIVRGTEGFTIEDLGSTNGTFVNGKRLSGATLLKNGDMVGLGETVTLGYELIRPSAGAGAGPSPAAPVGAPPPQQPQGQPPQPAQPAQAEAPANPYQPPQESTPPPQPYQPPAQEGQGYPPQGYGQPPADPYQQGYGEPYQQQGQPGYYPPQQPGYGAPPQAPPGYDYDPYAVREEEGGRSTQWLLIGCALFVVISCLCVSVIGLVLIDTFNLWCDFPIVSDAVTALGYCQPIVVP